jgi:hypothetical protein
MHAVLVGKQAYYWSYMAPMARAYHARFGERAPVILIDGAQLQDPEYAMSVTWRKVRHCRLVFSFDMWALLHARLHGKSVNHIHHSLVGKGSAFKGERAFPPFYLAERLILPHSDRIRDLPTQLQSRARCYGHIPFDWNGITPLPIQFSSALQSWRQQHGLKIALLCTQGEFGAFAGLPMIRQLQVEGAACAIKLHGYINRDGVKLGQQMLDLGDCPTTLAVAHADVVVTDHSSAALEAHLLGKPVFCYDSPALRRLQSKLPNLSELAYLKQVQLFDRLEALQQGLRALVQQVPVIVTDLATPASHVSERIINTI